MAVMVLLVLTAATATVVTCVALPAIFASAGAAAAACVLVWVASVYHSTSIHRKIRLSVTLYCNIRVCAPRHNVMVCERLFVDA